MAKSTKQYDVNILSLEDLENAPLSNLRYWYEMVFRQCPPPKTSPGFLRGNLAWAIQAQAHGHDVSKLRSRLLKYAVKGSHPDRIQFKPGTRLIRTWQGETHEVTVLEKGYWYRQANFDSLSKIARLITGTRWSGPRFFGLQNKEE